MFRVALKRVPRQTIGQSIGRLPGTAARSFPRRSLWTTSSVDRPRSWGSTALRWGLALGAIYYYNTSSVFADEATGDSIQAPSSFSGSDLATVDSVIEEKKRRLKSKAEPVSTEATSFTKKPVQRSETKDAPDSESQESQNPREELEEEDSQEGAFNPETGEINWDCPCLGGMAHGPCGEEFRAAFSCFVYSNEEPKGMDCIDKFQNMQECFRKYPEVYGAELTDDELADDTEDESGEPGAVLSGRDEDRAPAIQDKTVESDPLLEPTPIRVPAGPKWEDATEANHGVQEAGRNPASK